MRPSLCLILALLSAAAWAQTPSEIVTEADKIRNPGQPFRATDTLTEYVSGEQRGQNVLVVFSKEDPETHQFRNLIRYVEPPRDNGKAVLLDGKVLWFYDPGSKASVRISPQQRLLGQAAIGDVLTVNLAVDYRATVIGDETILDAGRQNRNCFHLDLKAANDQSVYSRVEYWVEHDSFRPIKARFYSDSGRSLKILYYRNFEERLGRVRPTEAVIIDAVNTALVTILQFGDYRFQDIPDSWFYREFLPRLKSE